MEDQNNQQNPNEQNLSQPAAASDTNNSQPPVDVPAENVVAPTPTTTHTHLAPANNPSTLILQWLTYALWGWTILAMSTLAAMVFANYIKNADVGSFSAYVVAAVIVLLPISLVTDHYYFKREPAKKEGGASLIMVIYAVLFALFCIASLITIVFSFVNYFTSSSGASDTTVFLLTAIITMILYGTVFLRVLTPHKPTWVHKIYMEFMIVAVGVIVIFGIIGPTWQTREARSDTLIENNLQNVSIAVDTYTSSNGSLPTSLSEVQLSGDSEKLVTQNLVQYIPNSQYPGGLNDGVATVPISGGTTRYNSSYYYELCVSYKKANGDPSLASNTSYINDYGIDAYDHPAGHVCYKIVTNS